MEVPAALAVKYSDLGCCWGWFWVFPAPRASLDPRSGVERRHHLYVERLERTFKLAAAATRIGRPVSVYTLRHSLAMHLLQSGVDITVIALWLGHESPTTTHTYVEADLAMKERALSRLQPPGTTIPRYRPPDKLMRFLQTL